MGAFGEHFGLPWGTLESAIMELFLGLVPGRVPRWILGAFFGAFGGGLGRIFEVFWELSGSSFRGCFVIFLCKL